MKKFLLILLLISLSSFSFADEDEDDFKFLRCVEASNNASQNTKYFEVSVSKQIMIERNGFSFTYTRITPFLIQAELQSLAKISLHRHLGTMAYTKLNSDGSSQSNTVFQCDSVPRLL